MERAKTGDVVAIREVFNRLVGKPLAAIDPDRLDLDEAQLASTISTQELLASLSEFR